MAFRDYDFERDYGLVPDIVKQFVVYLYRHIRCGHGAAAAPLADGGGRRVWRGVQC
jgi:hypothetical protein